MDKEGDRTKQPPECKETSSCPNMKFVQGSEGELYYCETCGARYKLYYEDMK